MYLTPFEDWIKIGYILVSYKSCCSFDTGVIRTVCEYIQTAICHRGLDKQHRQKLLEHGQKLIEHGHILIEHTQKLIEHGWADIDRT